MRFVLTNGKTTATLVCSAGSLVVESDVGKAVIETVKDLHAGVQMMRVQQKYLVIVKAIKQTYETDEATVRGIVATFGGRAYCDEELSKNFRQNYWFPIVMFLIAIGGVLGREVFDAIDLVLLGGAIGHLALMLIGKTNRSLKLFRILGWFNLYYVIFWVMIAGEIGWWFPGFMIGLMLLGFWATEQRYRFLILIEPVEPLPIA